MGQALYRKYRSRSLDEIVGQEPIVATLKKALRNGRISHAYLLSGPRGVGKTSVARILAHEVNKLPYKGEDFHIDIIEIDAASNRRIDEVRDIREKVHIAPTSAKYKVYIIDEVHMLTKEAFNALLKTLEEPPEYCIFILATTEPHKLPSTIISRTQRFSFKPIGNDQTVAHLNNIAKKEKISIEPEALQILADHGEGSLRDSIGLVDQLSGFQGKITVDKVNQLLGLPPSSEMDRVVEAVVEGDQAAINLVLSGLRDNGVNASQTAKELGLRFRQGLIDGSLASGAWLPKLLKALLSVSSAKQPEDMLEIVLMEASLANYHPPQSNEVRATPKMPLVAQSLPSHEPSAKTPKVKHPVKPASFDLGQWPQVLDEIKKRAASVYTALRLARPQFTKDELILKFQFPLHRAKVAQAHNIDLISRTIRELFGANIVIKTIVETKETPSTSRPTPKAKHEDLSSISNIFGSAEVL